MTLAALALLKNQLVDKLRSQSNLSAKDLTQLVERLMRIINIDDEPILHELITGYLFNPSKQVAGVTLDGHQALILFNFYLGYCTSDERVAKANEIQFEKKSLPVKDFFVPLLDDWFIRPLYFVDSLDDNALQALTQAIYAYLGKYFVSE